VVAVENAIWIFAELLIVGVSIVFYFFVMSLLLQKKIQKINFRHGIIIAASSFALWLSLLFTSENFYLNIFATPAILFSIGWLCFENSRVQKIMAVVFTYFVIVVSEQLGLIIFFTLVPSFNFGGELQFGFGRFVLRIFLLTLNLFFIILIARLRKGSFASVSGKQIFALCVPAVVSSAILISYTWYVFEINRNVNIHEISVLLGIIFINIFYFIIVENLLRQNEKTQTMLLIEAQNEAQQLHIRQLMDNHEKIRQMSHDFKQQVDVFSRLCEEKHYDELSRNLSELSDRHSAMSVVKTGNLLLDTILSSKKEAATAQGFELELNLNVQPELDFITMEVCILLGNAIDNAIEACARSASEKKLITMELTADSSRFLFHLKNNIGKPPQKDGEFLKTQKPDNLRHGIGLRSIKQISQKLGGNMTYEYDDEHFSIWIHLRVRAGRAADAD
jgi:hypothetical protein